MRVSLLITCVVDVVAPDVGEASVRLLRAAGCDVTVNLAQTCCGQPGWNAGFADDAAAVARTTLAALEADLDAGAEAVVVPAGSCATMVRVFWPELFEVVGDHDAATRARRVGERTRELSELLAARAERLPPLRLHRPVRVALHESCHMLRELRIDEAPRQLVAAVEGCDAVPWAGSDRCCGFGGTFSVKLPETSVAMADQKLRDLDAGAADADLLVGCDTSCLMHLQARADVTGPPIHIRHLAEVLAAALPEPPAPGRGPAPRERRG
ncbi:MAG TPA: (Fe-S)-binding protein [Acidimicrobiales bacterium]|nr:(Fe-S)-binding protein [Acidimicrobiales bacterium]